MDAKAPFNPGEPGRPSAAAAKSLGWRPERCDQIALIFQGGGALGAYQAGVYEALHEADIEPDWVTGVSIGAINAAIIAGNPREERLDRLRAFWQKITDRHVWAYTPDGDIYRHARNATSAMMTMTLGQPGFFKPHDVNPWLNASGAKAATSFYEFTPLGDTLREFVDFSLINDRQYTLRRRRGERSVRQFHLFRQSQRGHRAGTHHGLGRVPPALPMVKIGTDYYWDGGIVSNTPLQHLLDQDDLRNTLVFQVDLSQRKANCRATWPTFSAATRTSCIPRAPATTPTCISGCGRGRIMLTEALAKMPDHLLSDDDRKLRDELAEMPDITILHLIYQQKAYEGHAKDYDFSGTSMREHWQSGYEDTRRTLMHHAWLQMPESGIVVHDVHRLRENERR